MGKHFQSDPTRFILGTHKGNIAIHVPKFGGQDQELFSSKPFV